MLINVTVVKDTHKTTAIELRSYDDAHKEGRTDDATRKLMYQEGVALARFLKSNCSYLFWDGIRSEM